MLPTHRTYNDVGSWTNDHHCANTTQTNSAENAQWLRQSIVDQSTGAVPTFSYPSTGMTAFLCRTVVNGPPNNSSPQGQIFYSQITATNPPAHYNVYSVDSCPKAEIVFEGTVTALTTQNGTVNGKTAIEQDMAGGPILPVQCFHRLHQ